MTRVKSLKYEVERAGHGHIHRVHRTKKNRKSTPKYTAVVQHKKDKEGLKIKELEAEIREIKLNESTNSHTSHQSVA